MRIRFILTPFLILITIIMSCFLRLLLRIYRLNSFIGTDLTPKDLEYLQTILRYQNIIWILIFIIITGLIVYLILDLRQKFHQKSSPRE